MLARLDADDVQLIRAEIHNARKAIRQDNGGRPAHTAWLERMRLWQSVPLEEATAAAESDHRRRNSAMRRQQDVHLRRILEILDRCVS